MSIIKAIGIDRGFGAVKYYGKGIKGFVDSLVAPINQERAKEIINNNINDENVIVIKYNDQYYLVGSYVSSIEPNYAERDLKRDRNGINEQILFIVGMGLATEKEEEVNVIVTTGLPTDDYDKYHTEYKEKIENKHNPYVFSLFICGEEIKKSIKVLLANIENQPKGTIIANMNEKLKQKETWGNLNKRRVGVGDIGFNTTDLSMYVGKDIIKGDKNNFSTFAMAQILSDIKKDIEDNNKCQRLFEDDVLDAIITGEIKIRGKMVDCKKEVQENFEKKANLLVQEISSKWVNYLDSLDELILTGGVVENKYFLGKLSVLFEEKTGWIVSSPKEPRFANALGFYLISCSLMQSIAA